MEDVPASSNSHRIRRNLDDVLEEILRFSKENGGITKRQVHERMIDAGIDDIDKNVIFVVESIGARIIDDPAEISKRKNAGPAPWNSVGMYLRNAPSTRLLSREEERAWFQIIEASNERIFDLFSRYPFAAEMYIRELEHLAAGNQHFDSVVSESSGMSCAAYKKAIPGFRKSIAEAIDILVGASALHGSMSDGPGSEVTAELLKSARESVGRLLKGLSFRQSVVEDLCDVAYEDVYLPYLERLKSHEGENCEHDESAFGMFGMTLQEFVDSFTEVRHILDLIHKARSKIAEANLRLVVHVAKKYSNRGVELSDILQDGSIGLMNAIRKFDMSRGHKFSTFATWWIRQAISRALTNNSRTIRIPSHKIDQLNKLDKAERELSQTLHRPPAAEDTARKMGISVDEVCQLHDIRQQTVSLDGSLGDDGDASLSDVVGDNRGADPAEETEKRLMCDKIREALSALSDREKMVIDMRFGLSDGGVRTLEEIGKVFNVTREHIRQVELEALEKLRGSNVLSSLAELVR